MNKRIHILVAMVLLVVVAAIAGCAGQSDTGTSVDAPPGVNPDPESGPAAIVQPSDPDLATPESAVVSYLDWVTFAYRMANSEVATPAMTVFEEVRVDSYVELNRQKNQAIEQTVTVIEFRDVSIEEPTATVSAYEEWRYRYFTLDTIEWVGDVNETSYDTVYTVVKQPDGTWLVDSVEATPLTEVP